MNTRTMALIAMAVMIVYIIWLITTKRSLNMKIAELEIQKKATESNYLKLLEEYMKKTSSIPQSAIEQLEELKNAYSNVNNDIAAELCVVLEMLHDGKETIAIEKLTKIIENILKVRLEEIAQKLQKEDIDGNDKGCRKFQNDF